MRVRRRVQLSNVVRGTDAKWLRCPVEQIDAKYPGSKSVLERQIRARSRLRICDSVTWYRWRAGGAAAARDQCR